MIVPVQTQTVKNAAPPQVHFHLNQRAAADSLVKRFHYSHRLPGNVRLVGTWHLDGGLFGDTGPAIAACYFSSPPTRWSEPVLELSRLVRHDGDCPPLSGLISQTCRWAQAQGADLLVSFADVTHDHHGGVYQAASWQYAGLREPRMDGVIVAGNFIPGRSANAMFGTRSPSRIQERHNITVEPHYDKGKHCYFRCLNRGGRAKAERLGLVSQPYPKPLL